MLRVFFKNDKVGNFVHNMLGRGVIKASFEERGSYTVFLFPTNERLRVNTSLIEAIFEEPEENK